MPSTAPSCSEAFSVTDAWRSAAMPRMGEGDDEVGAFLPHLGHIGLGGLDDVAGVDLAGQMRRRPRS